MKTINALSIRQHLGKILKDLEKSGQPILLSKNNLVMAALVPIELFNGRFLDVIAEESIHATLAEAESIRSKSKKKKGSSLQTLRKVRGY